MRNPITLRPLTLEEQQAVRVGLRSPSSFTLRRGQILRASQRGQQARQIAERLPYGDQTVCNVLQAFNTRGLAALEPRSSAPHQRPQASFDAARRERLRALRHQSPRTFGYPTSVWALPLAAQAAYANGITPARGLTTQFLAWCSERLVRLGKQALLLVWANASWHNSREVPAWIRRHNQRVKQIRLNMDSGQFTRLPQ